MGKDCLEMKGAEQEESEKIKVKQVWIMVNYIVLGNP